jgi:hypothetical protein
MSSSRHLALAVAGLVLIVSVGSLFLVVPVYRGAAEIRRQIDQYADCGELDNRRRLIDRLESDIAAIDAWMAANQRSRPESADVAGLIKALSRRPVDGRELVDRSFTAREPKPAVAGEDFPEMAVPVDVTLRAAWPAIYELLGDVERLDRLVRVAAVQLENDRVLEDGTTLAAATITLEAIFDPTGEPRP